jgi:hypothetical protein
MSYGQWEQLLDEEHDARVQAQAYVVMLKDALLAVRRLTSRPRSEQDGAIRTVIDEALAHIPRGYPPKEKR